MFFKSEVVLLTLMVLESDESNTEKNQSSEAYSRHYCQHSPLPSPEGMEMVSKTFADVP